MSGNTIELLHLSDLHFGPHSRFADADPAFLGRSFARNLLQERERLKLPRLDLVIVTGDFAEAGKPKEFATAAAFLGALAGDLGLERREFVFVPGNHDISWFHCQAIELKLKDEDAFTEEEFQKQIAEAKLDRYVAFLKDFYGADPGEIVPLLRGACLYKYPSLPLAVAALNSCEAESHRPKDHKGLVSEEQAQAVMNALRAPDVAGWVKMIAVHHNPVVTVPANIADWRKWLKEASSLDDELLARYESDIVGFEGKEWLKAIAADTSAQLVLHGHHHAKGEDSWPWRKKGRAHVLSSGSLTLEPGHLPKDEPASFRLISLDLKKEIRAQGFVFDVRARAEGAVEKGAFVPDPAEPEGYVQDLDLPAGLDSPKSEEETAQRPEVERNPGPSPEFLRAYRQRLGSLFSRWDLAFAGVAQAGGAGRPIEATLDDMYLPLRLAVFDPDVTDEGSQISPEDLLARRKPFVIRGPAGAGKTTWIRWTFRRLLGREDTLPLIVVLRDLARRWQDPGCKDADRSIDAFLSGWLADRLGDENLECRAELQRALAAEAGTRPVLLVDGWDEIGPLGEEFRSKLLGLMAEHPRLLVVVTSRPYGEGRPSNSEGFEVLDIQPLSDPEIADLASRFFHRCYGEEQVTAEAEAERLVQTLDGTPDAKALARTALLLTMMLLISRSRPLPDKRHLLYEACIENLLTAIPKRRALQGVLSLPDQWRPEDSEERMREVAAMAFRLQREGYKKRSRSSIVQTWDGISSLLPEQWPLSQKLSFLSWLAGPAGLLIDRADGTLTFTHLSFQEFLTAWHLNATVEGKEDRIHTFRKYLGNIIWWETLRLWAALIERQSPHRLDPVLEDLSRSGDEGLSLSGMMLADGLGEDLRLASWIDVFAERLSRGTWGWSFDLCSRAWAASRQEKRKEKLGARMSARAPEETWPAWLRYDEFLGVAIGQQIRIQLPREGTLGRVILSQLEDPTEDARSIAAGRILCGGPPIWPPDCLEVSLLHGWPSQRRLAGLSLQLAVTCGATRTEILPLVKDLLRSLGAESVDLDLVRDLARDLARAFVRDFARYFARDLAHGFVGDFARDFARYLARYLGRYLAPYLTRYLDRYFAPDFSRDFASESPRYFARDFARYLARYFARDFARHFARDLAGNFARYLARRADLDEQSRWIEGYALYECSSFGRVAVRSLLASARPADHPTLNLMIKACRHSFGRATATEDLLASSSLPPLWPALARHIARLSTPEDRALLIDLAQHPEKCEPPLSWGLQYIVRGDILMEDGSVVTLDELADEVGLPHLPYLEDMPPELEIDWDAK